MKKNKLMPGMLFVFAIAFLLAPTAMATYNVLWDTSHGVYTDPGGSYDASGYYSKLSDYLTTNGFSVNTTGSVFNSTNLAGVDVAVVAVPSSFDSVYGTSEIAALKTFVDGGGGLLIMGENTAAPIANVNPLALEFGITFGPEDLGGVNLNITDLSSHQIFDGIDQVSLSGASELTLSGSAVEVATYGVDSKTAIAVSEYGLGRVVAIGDGSLWKWGADSSYDQIFDLPDNQDFALNTFEYLAVPEPATLVILGIGGLFIAGKKRHQ